ncbi:MFS transporter [Phycicoccus sp. Soil748]|uniref:MFS transporter n=1 Tax=Phycicoccus sp. Soil748 TaxID=1736397 RepID=UPI000702B096|nr:MFS transporter [Phycicoccus sp. Soil748]
MGARSRGRGALWRIRDLRVILPARVLSYTGDTLTLFALTLRVHDEGGGASGMALLLAAFALPMALTVGIAGHVADRCDSRRVLVTASLVQAAALAGLVLTGTGPQMYLFVIALQLGQSFANPTWAALLPRAVGEHNLGRATAVQQGALAVTGVVGAAVAGVSAGHFGHDAPLWIALGAFVALAAAAAAVRTRRRGDRHAAPLTLAAQVWSAAGFRVLHADPVSWTLLSSMVPFVLALETANVLEVFLVRDSLDASTTVFGLVQAASAAGTVAGAAWASQMRTERSRVRLAIGGVAGAGASMLVAGAAPDELVLALSFAGIGVFVMASTVCLWPVLLTRTVEADRGKVSAAANGASRLASMVALGLGALAGGYLGPRWSFALAGLTALAVAARSWHHLDVVLLAGAATPTDARTDIPRDAGAEARPDRPAEWSDRRTE